MSLNESLFYTLDGRDEDDVAPGSSNNNNNSSNNSNNNNNINKTTTTMKTPHSELRTKAKNSATSTYYNNPKSFCGNGTKR